MADGAITGRASMDWAKFWPVAAFFIAQSTAAIWWAATTQAEMQQLQDKSEKFERLAEDIPEMKASLKNLERMMERVLDEKRGKL